MNKSHKTSLKEFFFGIIGVIAICFFIFSLIGCTIISWIYGGWHFGVSNILVCIAALPSVIEIAERTLFHPKI